MYQCIFAQPYPDRRTPKRLRGVSRAPAESAEADVRRSSVEARLQVPLAITHPPTRTTCYTILLTMFYSILLVCLTPTKPCLTPIGTSIGLFCGSAAHCSVTSQSILWRVPRVLQSDICKMSVYQNRETPRATNRWKVGGPKPSGWGSPY